MKPKSLVAADIDGYISQQPDNVQALLKQMRTTIKKVAPKAEEVISYQMPAFKFHGMLVYFAAFKNHIGFYPTASAITAFKKELSEYAGAKGTVRFPFDEPLPLKLIAKITKFRAAENLEKSKLKEKAAKKSR
ncbi:MAG: DUF1801 domain-containing protein [Bacteroidota bacterium]